MIHSHVCQFVSFARRKRRKSSNSSVLLVNSENLRVMRWGGLSILMRGNPCLRRCAAPRCDGRADAWTLEGRRTSVDFELTDKQRKLVATFRAFGEETFTPEHVRQWRRDQGLPDEVVKGFVDLYFGLEEL